MNQRLELMTDVAKTKWNAKAPIADADREREQLTGLVKQGSALGLKKETVEAFFRAQFAAARRLQELHHQTWAKSGQQAFAQSKSLNDLRGGIDQVNLELLNALAKIQPVLNEAAVQERLRTRSVQVIALARHEVREMAVQPLLRKQAEDKR